LGWQEVGAKGKMRSPLRHKTDTRKRYSKELSLDRARSISSRKRIVMARILSRWTWRWKRSRKKKQEGEVKYIKE